MSSCIRSKVNIQVRVKNKYLKSNLNIVKCKYITLSTFSATYHICEYQKFGRLVSYLTGASFEDMI